MSDQKTGSRDMGHFLPDTFFLHSFYLYGFPIPLSSLGHLILSLFHS